MKTADVHVHGAHALQPYMAQDTVHSASALCLGPPACTPSARKSRGMHDGRLLRHTSILLKGSFRPESGMWAQSW